MNEKNHFKLDRAENCLPTMVLTATVVFSPRVKICTTDCAASPEKEKHMSVDTKELRQKWDATMQGKFIVLPEPGYDVWESVPAMLDALDASADTIDRLQRNNKDQRMLLEISSARIDELLYNKAQTQALDAAQAEIQRLQADNARMTAENAALRERCAAAIEWADELHDAMWNYKEAGMYGGDCEDISAGYMKWRGPTQEGAGQ